MKKKEVKERKRGTGTQLRFEEEERPYLSVNEKEFCRIFVQNGGKHVEAAEAVYVKQEDAATYGYQLLQKPKITHYIDFLRKDVMSIRDREGQAVYEIRRRLEKLEELIEAARQANNFQAVGTLEIIKNGILGTRKPHSVNLAHYDDDEERRTAIFDAVGTGELDIQDFKILSKALQQRQEIAAEIKGFRVELPANGKINE